ncbi:xanthine dehydrogenase family protein molybdopterin-binding subunit [Stutzerimonas azotifigens]|uniref:Xanthine dehydrogenase family protein molybdopterin-binding subunit n=1 Tax=Stutzerimonas azotifigens TaxID=291995 RepID=A0ABR5Z2V7_9GAMM|nr:xanthine dehydrogenase family protein molybdopterin-binding subunit [Stutzerimonas azotifigens]MBA1274500.1 xanthine dehydrogenase family protein molybdopterin-binding subunit [Stutzerimonas azotifigens]
MSTFRHTQALADGPIGQPVDRIDGRLKVTGRATYAYEQDEMGPAAYGYILGATIATGRIDDIDTRQAERAPGVLYVMTYRNAPPQPAFGPPLTPTPAEVFTRARPVLATDRIRYYDEPVALVVALTFEAARSAASLIRVRYTAERGDHDLFSRLSEAYTPTRTNAGLQTDSAVGDFDTGFEAAPVKLDVTYYTPYQSHNPMEPHASIASWAGNDLTLYTSAQTLANFRGGLANTLGIPRERIRVVSPYVGGGFGAKLIIHPDAVLAAFAARVLQRPVKVALTRQQMYANAGHRAAMQHQVRLGADSTGKLLAIGYDVWSATSRFEEFCEQTAVFARSLYAAPSRLTRHRLVPVDLNRGEWMRSPGEAPGMLAFESAMDELAERLNQDPIDVRVLNEPEIDPERGVPFATRSLVACMRTGAERFGWNNRNPAPGRVREGRRLIGMGMAAAIRPNYLGASRAQVSMSPTGRVLVRLDMTDIGTGTYTILTQVAAQSLGVPMSSVQVQLGDSRFPQTAGSGGSWGAASAGSAVEDACQRLKQQLIQVAGVPYSDGQAQFAGGRIIASGRSERLTDLMMRAAPTGLQAEGSVGPMGDSYKNYSQHSNGAHFVEVSVDMDTGEIRMRRMLSVIAAGRILNPKTARSQILGGMTWGIGAALMEQTLLDTRHGHFINHDLAEYLIPVNGDIADMDVVFLEEADEKANVLGIKGLGELGVCGAGAAVANAVYNATGIRVREFPLSIDKLLPALAARDW